MSDSTVTLNVVKIQNRKISNSPKMSASFPVKHFPPTLHPLLLPKSLSHIFIFLQANTFFPFFQLFTVKACLFF